MSQKNLETMIMQNFGGGKRGVLWDCASSELDRSNSRPLGPKWCSNALPYRRILSDGCSSKNNRRRFLSSVIKLVYIRGTWRHNSRWKAILDAGYAVHGTL